MLLLENKQLFVNCIQLIMKRIFFNGL